MRAQIRIVAGQLRGRKVSCNVSPDLRPTPDRVREALFSILGNAIPERAFVDIFAGTGVVGLEALSRGARQTLFVERDVRLAADIDRHLREFGLAKQGRIYRTDAYRWVSAWQTPAEPVNVFLSPPFADLEDRPEEFLRMLVQLQEKVADDSVVLLQAERGSPVEDSSLLHGWERRTYSRNVLYLWQKEETPSAEQEPVPDQVTTES